MSIRLTTPLLALLAMMALTACETVKGMGQDVQGAGAVVTQSADEVQNDM